MEIKIELIKNLNTLQKVESSLNKKTMKEKINETVLLKLINSDLLIKSFNNPASSIFYENEKQQLQQYKKIIKNGYALVKYEKIKSLGFGRVQPYKALGLISLRREIRQTLAKNTYEDIDVENCHPVIIYNLCLANGWVCSELEFYIKNRDKCLARVMKNMNCSRDEAKKLYIILMYFGCYKTWAYDILKKTNPNITEEEIEEPECIAKFRREIRNIGNNIFNLNPELVKKIEKLKEEKLIQKYNKTGSVVSFYCQEIENRILEECINYCYDKVNKNENYVLCYDGFMILKEHYKPELLENLEKLINNKFGFVLKFTNKEMKEDYLNILDDHLLLDEHKMEVEEQYLKYKEIIEKKYFMIEEGGEFGYFNDEGELKFQTYQKMKTIILKTYNYVKIVNGKNIGFNFLERWTSDINRKIYKKIVFNPHTDKEDELNLFTGFKYENIEYKKKDYTLILNFIKSVVQTDKAYNYIIEWIARIIQLKKRIDQAIILYSNTHGVGKSTIPLIIKSLLGKKYCSTLKKIEDITKEFNGQFENKFFTYGDEIKAKSNNLYDDLKDIITASSLNINKKGINDYELPNYNNFLFTTNNYNMVKIEEGDRRLSVINCIEKKMEQNIYDDIYKALEDDDIMASLFNFFKNYKLSAKFEVLETEQKKDLQKIYMSSCIKYVYVYNNHLLNMKKMTSTQLFNKIKEYETKLKITDCSSLKDMNIKLSKLDIKPKKINGIMIYKFDSEFIEALKKYDEEYYNENKILEDDEEED